MTKQVIEGVIYDPEVFWESILDKVALCGIAGRIGVAAVNFEPDIGPFGKVLPRWVPSDGVAWHPSFDNPHDLRNPLFYEWCKWDLKELKGVDGLKNLEELKPDGGVAASDSSPGSITGATTLARSGGSALQDSSEIEYVTVVYKWERHVREMQDRPDEFAPKLSCAACGHSEEAPAPAPPEPLTDPALMMEGAAAPSEEDGPASSSPCPECGEPMALGGEMPQEEAFPGGKRLTIFAPLCGVELYCGGWPQPSARTFPFMVFVPDPFPGDPVGGSLTMDHRSNQLAIDMLMRIGLEHMQLAKPYIGLPDGGVWDYQHEPWEFREDQGLGIFYDPAQPGDGIRLIQASGAPPALISMYQMFVGSISSNSGTGDPALNADQIKGTTASTLAQAIETGEIPVDHIIQMFRRALTPFLGVILDIRRDTITPEEAIRYAGEDGQWLFQYLTSQDIPNADVILTAEPELQQVDQGKVETLMKFVQSVPPEFYQEVGTLMRIPITTIRRLEEAKQAAMDREAEASAGAGNAGPQPSGAAPDLGGGGSSAPMKSPSQMQLVGQ